MRRHRRLGDVIERCGPLASARESLPAVSGSALQHTQRCPVVHLLLVVASGGSQLQQVNHSNWTVGGVGAGCFDGPVASGTGAMLLGGAGGPRRREGAAAGRPAGERLACFW